ncbi:hypothetical protein DKX38_014617 [Salix brachista]|uniref:Uncharacterized protein n=1 Tax=Salix brachista TaxID=2182728 RepID=A0A5N5LFS2_9ROSI|nr:hypothetical protein DKX38_014617 [Salix brachista]
MAEQPKQAKDAQRDKTDGEKKKVMLARVLSFLGVQSFAKGLCQSTGHTPFFSKENEDLDTQKREKGVRPHQPPSPEVGRV